MAEHLAESGRLVEEFRKNVGDAHEELAQLGFPPFARFAPGGAGGAPFDTVTSFLRGMKGSMLDMYRRPDKLLRAGRSCRKRLSTKSRHATMEGRSGFHVRSPIQEVLLAWIEEVVTNPCRPGLCAGAVLRSSFWR